MAGHSRLYRLSLIAIGALTLEGAPAVAADWTIGTTLTQGVSATDNVEFDIDDPIPAIGSNSSIGFNVSARSLLYDFNFKGNWGYQVYFGENQDIPDPQYIPNLTTSYLRRAKDLTLIVGGSYSYTPGEDQRGITIIPAEGSGEPDDGEPDDGAAGDEITINTGDGNADRQVVSVNTTVAYKLNARNDLSWTTRASRIDFFGDTADSEDPSTNASTSVAWSRRETRRISLNVSTGVDWYSYENDENQVNYVYFVSGGFTNKVTRRLTVNSSLGVRLLDSYQDVLVGPPPSEIRKSEHSTDFGGTGSFGFNYALKRGGISGTVSYGLTPDDDGTLENSLSATLGFNHAINDRSSFGVGAGYRLSDSEVDGVLSNMSLSISPRYSYTLARDWQLGLGYSFTMQNDDDGNTMENRVNLTISRSYTILP